jgi:hypothetical protein
MAVSEWAQGRPTNIEKERLATVASPLFYYKIAYAAGTFLPGILYNLQSIPSYAITIPFSSLTESHFEPADVSIGNDGHMV